MTDMCPPGRVGPLAAGPFIGAGMSYLCGMLPFSSVLRLWGLVTIVSSVYAGLFWSCSASGW